MNTPAPVVPATVGGEESAPGDVPPCFLCRKKEDNGNSKSNKSNIIIYNHLDFIVPFKMS